LNSHDWFPSEAVANMVELDDDNGEILEDGLTESEAEFLVEDIDEHAS